MAADFSYAVDPIYMGSIGGQFGEENEFADDAFDLNSSGDLEVPSIDRWLGNDDPPWVAGGYVPSHVGHDPPSDSTAFGVYRSAPLPSECDTVPNDSGYGGSCVPPSIDTTSAYGEEYGMGSAPEVERGLGMFNLNQPDIATTDYRFNDTSATSETGSRRGNYCSVCRKYLNTKSELNKHDQRHNKPHRCPYTGCSRSIDGFASDGDLKRHERTVHKDFSTGGAPYICPYGNCLKKDKNVWPRADNFRSHLDRVHHLKISADFDLSSYQNSNHMRGGVKIGISPSIQEHVPEEVRPEQQYGHHGPNYSPETTNLAGLASQFSNSNDLPFDNDELLQSPLLSNETQYLETRSSHAQPSLQPSLSRRMPEQAILEETHAEVTPVHSPKYEAVKPEDNTATVSYQNPDYKLSLTGPPDGIDAFAVSKYLESLPKSMLETALHAKTKKEELSEDSFSKGTRATSECSECHKKFDMPCKLRKHLKRHEKPYGCTIPCCAKTFGSKNDWKRHEASQHEQPEVWQCGGPCQQIFQCSTTFKSHLQQHHDITDAATLDDRVITDKAGSRFWCGFCCGLVEETSSRPLGPRASHCDPRFDHIDEHYMGRNDRQRMSKYDWQDATQAQDQGSFTSTNSSLGGKGSRKRGPVGDSNVRSSKQRRTVS